MANFFPRWTNFLPLKIAICAGAVATGAVFAFTYYATPKTLTAGYQPSQPIPFSHKIHVDQLGLDCRYCHSFEDISGTSNVPSSNTCWNCHRHVQKESPKLQPLRDRMDPALKSPDFGKPVQWVRVHKLPDFVYFNHSAHLNRGVSCQVCHGQVDQMEVIYQKNSLSMGWCLECHRDPGQFVRPLEEVFNLKYDKEVYFKTHKADMERLGAVTPDDIGKKLVEHWNIHTKETCATCHH